MGLFRAFLRFLDIDHHDPRAVKAYAAAVDQARRPVLYTDYGVEDTVDGRFDMIVLHVFLILNRFPLEERQHKVLRYLLEEMFADMENSLREIGVGDLSVPKKIHRMVDALYGRLEAYEAAAADEDPEPALTAVLARNVYRSEDEHLPEAGRLARYVLAARADLGDQAGETILQGALRFPDPATIPA